jgi:predicted nucleic acid-binding protein
MILIDAGPMVALISASDRHHAACRAALMKIDEPMATVWPAFTEAMYLLRSSRAAQRALWEMVIRGAIYFLYIDVEHATHMRNLMEKYHDLPMDLADAALVHVAERQDIRRIFTLDRRDFTVYKTNLGRRFTIVPPLSR